MPENDILRFVIVLVGGMFVLAIIAKAIDAWFEDRKDKRRDERMLREMKEALNEVEDDPRGD